MQCADARADSGCGCDADFFANLYFNTVHNINADSDCNTDDDAIADNAISSFNTIASKFADHQCVKCGQNGGTSTLGRRATFWAPYIQRRREDSCYFEQRCARL